jgi:hypothetical protein
MGGLNYQLNSLRNNLKVFFRRAAELVHVEVRPREGMFAGRIGEIETARALADHKSLQRRLTLEGHAR